MAHLTTHQMPQDELEAPAQSLPAERLTVERWQRGQTLVEYALIIALVAIVVIAALLFLGPAISNVFQNLGNSI